MEEEIWIIVKELNEYYEISNYGNLRSIDRLDNRGFKKLGKILKSSINRGGGYPYVRLSINGKKLSVVLHRLVAKYFVENKDNKQYVNHIDSNRTNNFYKNLEWVTHTENMQHAKEFGFLEYHYGEKARNFKFFVEVINSEGDIIDILCGNKDMKDKGYDPRLINACFTGKQKSHRNCTFKRIYKNDNQK
jgi:hypothetical protein